MEIKVVVFDLDDTLYNEIEFVYSGFKEVAKHFCKTYLLNEDNFYKTMIKELETNGRGKVFDEVLKKFNIYSKTNVKKSISIYRSHKPDIQLDKNSKNILKYLKEKNTPIYIVTDGNKIVQQNKIDALNIDAYFKKIFITHRYGVKNAKPSTYCFEKIAKLEQMSYNQIVYIADNINKDFINIKKLGFQTIQIKQGMFKDAVKPNQYHADFTINSISKLIQHL